MRPVASLLVILLYSMPARADRLSRTVSPDHYDLTFVVDVDHARFEGTETIRVQVAESTPRIVLHAAEIEFRQVTIGAGATMQTAVVALDENNETATLTVPKALPRGPIEIHIRYTGILNDKLRGFYLSKVGERNYAVTQFEATDARRAFPCFDEPAFKATFGVTLTINRGDTAISNGRVLSDMPGPGPTRHTMKFATSPKMSSYLVAMAVGNFQCLQGGADGVPIRLCATSDKKEFGRIALESAEQILKFYNSYYTIKYPFGKLDIVAVPDFAAGAMENTAAIFFRESRLLADSKTASPATRKEIADIVAHEMAHQWFGNLVTMRWWDDLWLNEGFATWMENRALAALRPEWNDGAGEAIENQKALDLDSLRSTRPIHTDVQTPAEIDAVFDAIAYEKGAAVLRMMENYVGADPFRKGVNAYLQAHAYGNAASEDFWTAIASASGKPADRIMPTFLNQSGVPLLTVSATCTGTQTALAVHQQRFDLDPALLTQPSRERWQVPICAKAGGQSTATCEVLGETLQTFSLRTSTCAPWVFANAGAQGYYRTEYPPAMLRALAPRIERDLTAPERLTLVDDEWALVRAGRHGVGDYLTLARGYALESSSAVLVEVAARFEFIRQHLATDASATRFEAFTRTLFRPLFDELGFAPGPSDNEERRALRATIIGTLGITGNDTDVIGKARSALDRALLGGPPLDPALADAVVHVAAEHGDEKLYEELFNAARRATSPNDYYLYLLAVADFRDARIIDRALERTLSTPMRSQDTALYLARFFDNPVARSSAWAFVKSQWEMLEPKVSIFGGDVALTSALGAFCDAAARDDIKTFFATHPMPTASRTLDQTIERINNCIDLREKQTNAVGAWLQAER